MARERQARKCSGKRTDGNPCGAYAITGGTVCTSHGGQLPRVKARAAANLLEQRARLELADLDVQPVGDPLHQLAVLAGQILAWRDAMAEQVNNLTSLRYESQGENGTGEQLRAEVALWERSLDRCERVLTAMARLNIDERLAKITDRQADLIEQALKAALAEIGLDLDAQDRAARSVARQLRAVSPQPGAHPRPSPQVRVPPAIGPPERRSQARAAHRPVSPRVSSKP